MKRQVRRRRTVGYRLFTLLAIVVVAVLALSACDESKPLSTVDPVTSNGRDIQSLYKLVFWMALVVFIGVQFGIVYAALKYRYRGERTRPRQIHGNQRLEILWTIIPAIVLLVIFIPSVTTLYKFEDSAKTGDYTIEVYGKQWYWEVHYTKPNTVAGVVTANEIHVPAGAKIQFKLLSNNVIHSFWVPRMTGKTDVIPGHENELGFTAPKTPGVFQGECAEFCGTNHAWMRFRIIVDTPEQFNNWIAAYKAGPTQAGAQALGLVDSKAMPPEFALCLGCHRINGMETAPGTPVPDQVTGIKSPETNGPNLTLLGCRETLAAGQLENTPENLTKWLEDPGAVKPGNFMSTQIHKGTLKPDQISALVKYLEAQKIPGCK